MECALLRLVAIVFDTLLFQAGLDLLILLLQLLILPSKILVLFFQLLLIAKLVINGRKSEVHLRQHVVKYRRLDLVELVRNFFQVLQKHRRANLALVDYQCALHEYIFELLLLGAKLSQLVLFVLSTCGFEQLLDLAVLLEGDMVLGFQFFDDGPNNVAIVLKFGLHFFVLLLTRSQLFRQFKIILRTLNLVQEILCVRFLFLHFFRGVKFPDQKCA